MKTEVLHLEHKTDEYETSGEVLTLDVLAYIDADGVQFFINELEDMGQNIVTALSLGFEKPTKSVIGWFNEAFEKAGDSSRIDSLELTEEVRPNNDNRARIRTIKATLTGTTR